MPDNSDERSAPKHRGRDAARRPYELSVDMDPVGAEACRAAPEPPDDSASTVVVVASNPELTGYVCQGLSLLEPSVYGYEEHSIEGARGRVGTVRPELVILDTELHDGDGLEFCEELRSSGEEALPKVLLLVDGARRHELERKMVAVGADRMLLKPFNLSQLAWEAAALLAMTGREDGNAGPTRDT